MDAQSDAQLLRAYAERRSDAAFAELVRRHIDLVHSAARRMVGDAHLAQDVTQATFLALAKNAAPLTERAVLAGWLHRTAQNIAAQTVRTDVRRRAREQEAAAMNELLAASPEADWEQIAPHLDAALGELTEPERDAVLLRYFQRQSARDMAQTLGISDEAAQKRVSRAVDRLREFFAKRGVTVGASGLAVVISANAVQAAPVGLALTITTAATLAGTTLATTATVTATKAIAMTTIQKTIVAATIAILAGVGIYEARQVSQLREKVQALETQGTLPRGSSTDNALSTVQEKADRLATQNAELSSALTQAKSTAALYKELVALTNSRDTNPTNPYPTERHVWVGWGRFGRMAALSKGDNGKPSPEEKSVLEAAQIKLLEELPNLMKAAKQFEAAKPARNDQPAGEVSAEVIDMITCILYGALNLDELQFTQVYGVMLKLGESVNLKGLSKESPEASEAVKSLMEQWKAETQTLLTPEQARIFTEVVTHFQLEPGKFGFNFNF